MNIKEGKDGEWKREGWRLEKGKMETGEGKDGDGEGKDGDWRREGWIQERERMGKKGLRLEGFRLSSVGGKKGWGEVEQHVD